MASSTPALVVSLVAVALYAYSVYCLTYKVKMGGAIKFIPKPLEKYGQWKYLTFITLNIQLFSYVLHVIAHFIRPLQGFRDLVFTSLAFPTASVVCYTFWGVWHTMGRELIFPSELDAIFPSWLNHTIHTVIVPMNMITSFLLYHKHYKFGFLLTLLFSVAYTVFLHYIKAESGYFVYSYLEKFDDITRTAYFSANGVFTYFMYKSGQWLTYAIHGKKVNEGVRSAVQKKKQK